MVGIDSAPPPYVLESKITAQKLYIVDYFQHFPARVKVCRKDPLTNFAKCNKEAIK
jgi:hypothetical protein